jgi:D-alanyl-D-alanine endopeptidase (penicillin-binding protein 7)
MKFLILSLALVTTDLQARTVSTIIHNHTQSSIIIGDNINVTRPIASLTKLMTAMVALDYYKNDLDKLVRTAGSNSLPAGSYTRQQLLTALLVRSDNSAADAIARDYPGGVKEFVRAMNRKAVSINMNHTKFADPSGLSSLNVSNAGAVSMMVREAMNYAFIRESSVQKQVSIERRRQTIVLDNTNKPLLYDFDEILLSKTGYTSASGWSVALVLEKDQQRFAVVVLGAKSRDERYAITKKLISRYFVDIAEQQAQAQLAYENRSIFQKIWDWIVK